MPHSKSRRTSGVLAWPAVGRRGPSGVCLLLLGGCLMTLLPEPCLCLASACPSGCACDLEAVTCTQRNLTEIPSDLPANDTVAHLVVSRTSLTTVGLWFENLRALRTVDLNTNQIDKIAEGAFRSLSQLESLVLRRNNLSSVSNSTFLGLARLRHLDLSYNKMLQLTADCFHELASLESLDLTRNELETIDQNAFAGLTKLGSLNLSRNMLVFIEGQSLIPLSSLETLRLDDNNIMFLRDGDLSALVSLKTLSVNGNQIQSIDPQTFGAGDSSRRSCPLETLNLKGTALAEVPVGVFENLVELRNLDLSKSEIVLLQDGAFRHLRSLINLVLDNLPKLANVSVGAFRGLTNLQRLVMTNNLGLTDLAAGTFKNLPSLRVLDLHGNAVRHFDQGLADWGSLDLADLSQNPVVCDCHATWILSLAYDPLNDNASLLLEPGSSNDSRVQEDRHGARVSTKSKTETIECSEPPWLRGKLLTLLRASSFECPLPNRNTLAAADSDRRFKVGIIAACVSCVLLVCVALFLKFRRRICSFCRRQYRYSAYKGAAVNGLSPDVHEDVVEMESTEMEDLDSEAETIDTTLRT